MSNLINRQDAMNAIQKRADEVDSVYSAFWEGLKIAQDIVEKVPSAELEIIRCKDCKWRNVYQFPPKYDEKDYCDKHEKTVSTDGFCSWAKRRTNE